MCEPIPRCIVVESLRDGRVFTARLPEGQEPLALAEDLVTLNDLRPGDKWRWGTVDVEDPRVARLAHPVVVEWDPEVYTQRVEEGAGDDPDDEDLENTGT